MTSNSIQKKDEKNNTPILDSIQQLKEAVVSKTNCKLCQSKSRSDAEVEYERTGNIKAVQNLLKNRGEDICYQSIRNHLFVHYQKQEKAIRLKEYAESLKEWLVTDRIRRDSLLERIAIFNREMAIIAAETEGLGLEERRKSMIALDRAQATVMALEDKIDEMDREMDPVNRIITEFQNIISRKVKQTGNQETKRELTSVLEELKEKLGEMDIEKQDS